MHPPTPTDPWTTAGGAGGLVSPSAGSASTTTLLSAPIISSSDVAGQSKPLLSTSSAFITCSPHASPESLVDAYAVSPLAMPRREEACAIVPRIDGTRLSLLLGRHYGGGDGQRDDEGGRLRPPCQPAGGPHSAWRDPDHRQSPGEAKAQKPRPENWKTKPCKNLAMHGVCAFGQNCDFQHPEDVRASLQTTNLGGLGTRDGHDVDDVAFVPSDYLVSTPMGRWTDLSQPLIMATMEVMLTSSRESQPWWGRETCRVGADGKLNLLLQERYFFIENSVFSTDVSTGPFSEISRDAYDAASPKRPHLYIKVQELAFTSGPSVTSNTLLIEFSSFWGTPISTSGNPGRNIRNCVSTMFYKPDSLFVRQFGLYKSNRMANDPGRVRDPSPSTITNSQASPSTVSSISSGLGSTLAASSPAPGEWSGLSNVLVAAITARMSSGREGGQTNELKELNGEHCPVLQTRYFYIEASTFLASSHPSMKECTRVDYEQNIVTHPHCFVKAQELESCASGRKNWVWIDFINFFCPTSSPSSGLKHLVQSLAFKHDHRVVESSFQHPRPGVPPSLFC